MVDVRQVRLRGLRDEFMGTLGSTYNQRLQMNEECV